MVSRGFNNDGPLDRARSRKPSVKETLAEIMSSGKPYRQYLKIHGINCDMTQVQGVPGKEIASTILDKVIDHIDNSNPVSEAQNQLRTRAIINLGIISMRHKNEQ